MATILNRDSRGNPHIGTVRQWLSCQKVVQSQPSGDFRTWLHKALSDIVNLIANPALGKRLNCRPPEILSNLNGFCNKLISNNICKVCTQKNLKKQLSPCHRRAENFRKQDFSDAMYKNKTNPPPSSSTTCNIEQLH